LSTLNKEMDWRFRNLVTVKLYFWVGIYFLH